MPPLVAAEAVGAAAAVPTTRAVAPISAVETPTAMALRRARPGARGSVPLGGWKRRTVGGSLSRYTRSHGHLVRFAGSSRACFGGGRRCGGQPCWLTAGCAVPRLTVCVAPPRRARQGIGLDQSATPVGVRRAQKAE